MLTKLRSHLFQNLKLKPGNSSGLYNTKRHSRELIFNFVNHFGISFDLCKDQYVQKEDLLVSARSQNWFRMDLKFKNNLR